MEKTFDEFVEAFKLYSSQPNRLKPIYEAYKRNDVVGIGFRTICLIHAEDPKPYIDKTYKKEK